MVNLIDEAIDGISRGAKTLIVRAVADWCALVGMTRDRHPAVAVRLDLKQTEPLTFNYAEAQTWQSTHHS